MNLSLSLLGPVDVTWLEQPVTGVTNTVQALLAYLAIEGDRPHTRTLLAALLWPDHPQAAAYTNLRQTLARLRKVFPAPAGAAGFVTITPHTIQFVHAAALVDVTRFKQLWAACAAHAHSDLDSCLPCRERLVQAAALYRGELLQGLVLESSQPFDEWLVVTREALHRQALAVLQALTRSYEAAGDYGQMRHYAARQVALEPWREEAQRQLMQALAQAGDRSAALAQFEACRRVLHQELGLAPDSETLALYTRIRAGDLQPPARRPTPRHNLPAALTPFVGRDAELAELASLLQAPAVRLLTLVSIGGMGKTRLALELGRGALATFADGVFVVSLAPLTDAVAIAPTIAAVLGVTLHSDDPHHGGDLQQALLHALRPKQLLLILDNFEHLLTGVDLVVDLLEAAPQVTIIVTSREHLNLRGEHQYVVHGLSYAPHAPLAEAAGAAAVRLFGQSAQRVQPGFLLQAANLPTVLRICQLVQGMPLALELAAAWAGTLPLDDIAAEIAQSVDFLAVEWRDVPERQRSMRAVFEWSWQLLTAPEQQVFRQLAVFRGGFTRQAAQTVVGASLRVLTALGHKALVRVHAANGTAGRYELHELLRQFAATQLIALSEEHVEVAARHAAFYLVLAETAAPKLVSAEQATWLPQIEHEHDNLRAALAWAAAHHDLTLGLRLAGALWPFWQRRCHLSEGRRWLANFLRADGADAVAPEVRATALNGAGWLAHDQDDFAQADALFSEGLRLDQALGHTNRVATVLAHRGVMARGQGQYAEAVALVEESLAFARAAGDRTGVAYALFRLGLVTRERGEYARATAVYRECLATYRALGDHNGAAFALLGLGDVARDQGDAAGVLAACTESLAVGRELGQHWDVGFSLNNLALAALMQGELEQAWSLAAEALALFRIHGIRGGVIELLITQGQIACTQRDSEQAQVSLIEGVSLGWPAGPHWLVATGLEELARVAGAEGDAAAAARLCAVAAGWRVAMEAPLPPYRRASYEETLAAARDTLGVEEFAQAWADGAEWPVAEAVAACINARWSTTQLSNTQLSNAWHSVTSSISAT